MSDQSISNRLFVKSGNAMRMFLVNAALFIMAGIWLTGYDQVHWFLYAIPAIFTLAATFGICPGINLWKMILGN